MKNIRKLFIFLLIGLFLLQTLVFAQDPSTSKTRGGVVAESPDTCTKYYTCPNGTEVQYCETKETYDENGTLVGVACLCKEDPSTLCLLCTDSDGGKNYYVKGYIINQEGIRSDDECNPNPSWTTENTLLEYYCTGNSEEPALGTVYECPNGCKDGACVFTGCKMCENGIDTGRVDENGCPIYECPEEVCASFIDDEGCTITKCDGRITKESCPEELVGKYVRLNEEFTLIEGQSAKVTDYGYMKITLTNWMCVGSVCEVGTPCETSCAVTLQVEMPSECTTTPATAEDATTDVAEACAAVGTEIILNEGQSKDAFGAKISYLDKQGNRGVFVVQKPVIVEGGVDIEISPTQQSISYGEKAFYKVTVTDKHTIPKCETEPERRCLMLVPIYTYFIDVRNLPFSKEYPKQIELGAGESKTFELVVSPYSLMEVEKPPVQEPTEEVVEEKIIITEEAVQEETTEQIKPVTKPIRTIQETQKYEIKKPVKEAIAYPTEVEEKPEVEEKLIEITPTVIGFYRTYKFNVRVMQKNDPQNQDFSYAVLSIEPEEPPKPPEFPGEEIKVKLYKGWNLISLPGKLVKFEKIDLARKLIGFVYLKEKQEYVTLNEAERILGNEFREYLARNAFWVYSYQEIDLEVSIDRAVSYSDIDLRKGWNLVPVTEDMLGGYLSDIKGDCGFEKLYLWNADAQAWRKVSESYQFPGIYINYGVLIKVKEDCRLGGSVVSLTPPPMPE